MLGQEAARRGLTISQQPRQKESGYLGYLRATLPKGWTADAPHIRQIAEHLDAVERGEIDRLAIHLPPRHAKTETVSVRYAPYTLENNPAENVLLTGYNERFARRLGRKARNIATGRIAMDAAKQSTDEWATAAGGVLMTRGVGSPPTGVGFRRIIIDDPIRRREDAESELYREKVWDWYTDDLYTRLEPGGALILVATLWHEDDICARAVASEPGRWTVLKLPAIDESGAALWPERWDVAALNRIRDVMKQNEGERSFEALYQQNPTPREGAFFKVSQLAIEAVAPANARAVRCWDMAASDGQGDFTAGVKMATRGDGVYHILDIVRGQWSTDERNRVIRQTAELDGVACAVRGPQDPGSAGKDAAQAFVRLLAGFSVKTAIENGDKVLRADPFSAQVNAGNVRLIRGDWNAAFIEELRQFPSGKHDDMVDCLSGAFSELVISTQGGALKRDTHGAESKQTWRHSTR